MVCLHRVYQKLLDGAARAADKVRRVVPASQSSLGHGLPFPG